MKTFGLFGFPLSHSFSPNYFKQKFDKEQITDCQYLLFEYEHLEGIKKKMAIIPNLMGFNVTIPYKEKIIPFLDRIDPIAAKVGAVNTVKIENGNWIGYNTDVIGFEKTLINFLDQYNKNPTLNALVLGNGGASKAITFVLKKLGIPFYLVSRKKIVDTITYEDITHDIIISTQLIINTTPIGTFPNITYSPTLPYKSLTSKHLLYDLVYNPNITTFLQKGIESGSKTINGYPMLVEQAEAAWAIWNS